MRATDSIERLMANGVRLWLDGDRLRYSARRGALTRALREAVRANGGATIRQLQGEPPSLPEPLAAFNAIKRCHNGDCGAMVAFKAGCGFCKACGMFQRIVE